MVREKRISPNSLLGMASDTSIGVHRPTESIGEYAKRRCENTMQREEMAIRLCRKRCEQRVKIEILFLSRSVAKQMKRPFVWLVMKSSDGRSKSAVGFIADAVYFAGVIE